MRVRSLVFKKEYGAIKPTDGRKPPKNDLGV